MARKPNEIQHPQGYPIRLYKVSTQDKLVVAVSKEVAIKNSGMKVKKKEIIPVSVSELIASNGHSQTNAILRSFGSPWICKENKVFFKTLTN